MGKKKYVGDGYDSLKAYKKHLIEGKPLTDKEQELFELMRECNALLILGKSRNDIVEILTNTKNIAIATAYRIFHKTTQLFGNLSEADKEGLRYVHYQNFLRLADAAELDKKYDLAISANEKAAKLLGLLQSKKQEKEEKTPRTIVMNFKQKNTYVGKNNGSGSITSRGSIRISELPEEDKHDDLRGWGGENYDNSMGYFDNESGDAEGEDHLSGNDL